MRIRIVPADEFVRVRRMPLTPEQRVGLIADMCRLNTLAVVKLAGSGHLGSSFSAMEIVVWLYYEELDTLDAGFHDPNRDVYFSSKGHDVPGLYSVLYSLGVIPEERFLRLRRLGGLDGHPDMRVPGIECNSGSLGMGISKAKGIGWAKRYGGHGGHVYVLTGDGELQEGQNYEALHTAAQHGMENVTVIVDHNKVQTDRLVSDIVDLGNLDAKFAAFGWTVARCDGHDVRALSAALAALKAKGGPKVLIADTVKGRGVSFMEHPQALRENGGLYRWHAGAPDDTSFGAAYEEVLARIQKTARTLGLADILLRDVTSPDASAASGKREFVADAYGEALVALAERRDDIVVLDGDLAADCRVRKFEERFPHRFIENGIAEQDMVSTAGGLARMGLLPVVNTFASFLAARANEQIYNNATEDTRIIYVCHYAGIIPAGPGKSHQSVRDISLFGALPHCTIIQPCNSQETALALDYLVEHAPGIGVLRLAIGPSPRVIELPPAYDLSPGQGCVLAAGEDAVLFAYGPVMLHEALVASELLAAQGFGLGVVNMPWLNRIDTTWLLSTLGDMRAVYVLEDHATVGGLGDRLIATLSAVDALRDRRVRVFGVDGFPACGTPPEALRAHGLDGNSLAARIAGRVTDTAVRHVAAVDLSVYSAEAPQ